MTADRTTDCPSDLVLDLLFVGELTDRPEATRAHLERCGRCAGRYEERRRAAEAFGDEVDVGQLAWRTQGALRARTRRRAAVAAGLAAAAAAAVVLVALRPGPPPQPVADGVRTKGGLTLDVVARRLDGQIEQLVSPAALSPGEAIRFAVSSPAAGHLVIVGIDAAGAVTPYAPQAEQALPLQAADRTLLEGSILLDETLGPERIVAVLCDTPRRVAEVSSAARTALGAAGGDPVRVERVTADCAETSFLIEKVPAP